MVACDRGKRIVHTLRRKAAGEFIRPISARYMHRKEVENYERQTS
jgi:uncharacterized DUF497 family protein